MKRKQMKVIHLPLWKAYLYSLLKRLRIYRWTNSGMLNTRLNKHEGNQLKSMIHKYVRKEIQRQPKAFQYTELVNQVLIERVALATKRERAIAKKFLIVKAINVEDLMSEIKAIKGYAKEVGMKASDIKGLSVEDLTMEVLKHCDPKNSYTPEFVEWYEALPEELFDSADSVATGKDSGDDGDAPEQSELLEAIDDVKKKAELIEIAEEYPDVFGDTDYSKVKLPTVIKKQMKEAVEAYYAEAEEEGTESGELTEEELETIVETLNEAETSEELEEFAADEDNGLIEVFGEIEFSTGKGKKAKYRDVDEVRAEMLAALGVEEEEEEKSDDVDEAYAEFEAIEDLKELKAAAKELGVKVKIGMKREAILEAVAELLQEQAGEEEEEEEEEIELTNETVNDMEEAGDKDGLLNACEEMGIELKNLEKRSAKSMAKKLRDAIGVDESANRGSKGGKVGKPAKEDVEPSEEEEPESTSIYQIVEELLIDGAKEKDVIKAITPYYNERGMKALAIKKRAKQLIECISVDLD